MRLRTKIIHWGVFLVLSILWWFVAPSTPYPLSEPTAFGAKLLIWVFFLAGGMVVTSDDDGYDCEWQ